MDDLLRRLRAAKAEALMLQHPPGTGWADYFAALADTLTDAIRALERGD